MGLDPPYRNLKSTQLSMSGKMKLIVVGGAVNLTNGLSGDKVDVVFKVVFEGVPSTC